MSQIEALPGPIEKRNADDTPLPTVFPVVSHPFQPNYTSLEKIAPTNAWITNLFFSSVNNQAPTSPDPYILRVLDTVAGGPLGLTVRQSQQKTVGSYPSMNDLPAASAGFMINDPVVDMRFSAKEWVGHDADVRPQVTDWDHLSAQLRLSISNDGGHVDFPLTRGMVYITSQYHALTPLFFSQRAILSVTSEHGSMTGQQFTVSLNDGSVYRLYSLGSPITWQLVDENQFEAISPFTGTIRLAKLPDPSHLSLLDAHVSVWPVHGKITYTANSYRIDWNTEGSDTVDPLIYAYPHHQHSMINMRSTDLQLNSSTKGAMRAIIGKSWTMNEAVDQTNQVTWFPPNSHPEPSAVHDILETLADEIDNSDYDQDTNKTDNYFSGKALQKYALMAMILNRPDLTDLRNPELAKTSLDRLKLAFSPFLDNRQQHPYVFDTEYHGVVALSGLPQSLGGSGDPSADFGHSYYNDHHYHHGYLVVTAAIIHWLDPAWRADEIIPWTNALIRDVNAPEDDLLFAPFRNWDWFAGHSWAGGLKIDGALDGKDQESIPEAVNFYWGAKLWGIATDNVALQELTNLQLSILKRATYEYFWLLDSNQNYPPGFVENKVVGVYFEQKIDYTTYFGRHAEYIHGIQQLPMTPMLADGFKTIDFVQEEWDQKLASVASGIQNRWAGVVYLNYALINPTDAYQALRKVDLDDGQSRSYSLYIASTRSGFQRRALSKMVSGSSAADEMDEENDTYGETSDLSDHFIETWDDDQTSQRRIIDITRNHHDDRFNGY
ncbi:glycoside hydrolase [Hesseltinella vesiculosa]|uniref:glucan endo-1,3-beta-D-glucosidase n=1 Tax=Hesseltinella vesiculosa TaxID=101127 RepID=A0A1X2GRG6_9FUNG|nr:glycoside hydrolase [Hesseltinella vesiculosa]